jgi:hypothetical protein
MITCSTDVASPMHDSAYYAIPSYVVADTIKIKFLFLFLPRKENVRDTIGVQYLWSVLSLKESDWGPPSSMLKMVAHLQNSLFILVYCFIFYLGKVGPRVWVYFISIFSFLLVSQVIGGQLQL